MRVFLDECLDWRLGREFPDDDARTVPQMGWAGIKNGQLLALAQERFDAFVTVDRNLSYQQNLSNVTLVIVVLRAVSNRLPDLIPCARKARPLLAEAKAGSVVVVESEKEQF
jgi:hypothetical protein